jgi:hypothetical protein
MTWPWPLIKRRPWQWWWPENVRDFVMFFIQNLVTSLLVYRLKKKAAGLWKKAKIAADHRLEEEEVRNSYLEVSIIIIIKYF